MADHRRENEYFLDHSLIDSVLRLVDASSVHRAANLIAGYEGAWHGWQDMQKIPSASPGFVGEFLDLFLTSEKNLRLFLSELKRKRHPDIFKSGKVSKKKAPKKK